MLHNIQASRQVFQRFLSTVVNEGAFGAAERERDNSALSDAERRRIERGGHDFRTPKLMRISGKGGYVEGPEFARRKAFRNVSLLDHVVSVTRGALIFAEVDLRAAGVEESSLPGRLAIIAATAFLHDADKMLERPRTAEINVQDIDELARRFLVDAFLAEYDLSLSPAGLLQRIEAVEIGRVDRLLPGVPILDRDSVNDCYYIRLADRLDGAFLHKDKGVAAVVEELEAFEGLRSRTLKQGWRAARIVSPHTPFLLDKLQEGFAGAVSARSGMPPLIEVHHDGELLLIAPESMFDAALDDAIAKLAQILRPGLRVHVNPRGTRDLLDGGSSLEDLSRALETDPKVAEKALFVHIDVISEHREALLATFDEWGFGPRLGGIDGFSGKHFACWPATKDEQLHIADIRKLAATIAVALACPAPKDRQLAALIPDATVRERELANALAEEEAPVPEWIANVGHDLSRYTLLAIHATCASRLDEELNDRLIGERGVIRVWLEGDGEDRSGLLEKTGDPGGDLARAAGGWLRAAAARRFDARDERQLDGRCHFTATPVASSAKIDSKTGLYGLNVSAFSGREGRPEFHDRTQASTLVAPAAAAEHRLRALEAGGTKSSDEIPVLISSPGNAGLFAGLSIDSDKGGTTIDRYSLFDVMRRDPKERAKIFKVDVDNFETRTTIGRYDAMPQRMTGSGKTPGLISFAKIAIDSALRTGRAIHVFRGLPVPTNAFVMFDCLPNNLARAIGGSELRLEQLPDASKTLSRIETIAETAGLGLDIAQRILDPKTRFGAACEALTMLDRLDEDKQKPLGFVRLYLLDIARDPEMQTNTHDSVVVEFAKAMTRVQAAPPRSASNNERELGMRVALKQADEACRIGQTSRDSLAAAIAAGIENEFDRSSRLEYRGKKKARTFPRRRALEAAGLFVDLVWARAFGSKPPAGRERRVALAIYRMAFETASYTKRNPDNDAGEVVDLPV